MRNLLNELKKKQNKLVNRYINKTERTIIISKKPLSIWKIKQALIASKVIPDDGYKPKDIVDINQGAIWDSFRAIYERNERQNVKNGNFSFYIEEDSVMSQIFDVSPEQFQIVFGEICGGLGCSVSFSKEVREELPNLTLNKVTVKHNFFTRDLTAFFRGVGDE